MSAPATLPDNYTVLPFTMDPGIAARAAIGLVVLATDQTLEHEWRQIISHAGVAFYEARLHNSPDINPASLALMEKDIAHATGLILPGTPLQVVAFGCTSGSIVIGEEQVFARIREARPDVACTTPITAAMAALGQLGAKRIALLTPYVASINLLFKTHIEAAGVDVAQLFSFNHENDEEVARIDRASLRAAVLRAGAGDDVDAVFVSCTSLRMTDLIREVEAELGKPVVSSNVAMAWHALRLAGIRDPQPQFGRLFEL
jgi:maleate isomerase